MTYSSSKTYEKKGYVSVPQRSGSTLIYGPSAKATINTYAGFSLLFFGLGSYFSFIYIRIRSAKKQSTKIIVPEECIPEELICPSCLFKSSIYSSLNLTCPKCNNPMEEVKGFFDRRGYPSEKKENHEKNYDRKAKKLN